MITPELVGYIRGEFAKGRTREDIRKGLETEGGWGEADLSEAFRIVMPMQGFGGLPEDHILEKVKISVAPPSIVTSTLSSQPSMPSSLPKIFGIIAVVLFVGALGFGIWFYRTPLSTSLSKITNSIKAFSSSLFSRKPKNNTKTATDNGATANTISIKNCGVSAAPNLNNPLTYQNNGVLNCLGESALRCEDAKAVLEDPIFPSVFQIIKNQESCDLKLSYPADSMFVDAAGNKLAGQYISCPIATVKAVDETKNPPLFTAPAMDNYSKYGSQIYFYGTLGIFIESNLDQNKIKSLGCSGPYIDSLISSYQKTQ